MPIYRKCSICNRKVKAGTKCKCEIDKKKESYREYNKYIRNSKENIKYTKFYNSVAWKRMSDYIRIKYHGMCLMCLMKHDEIRECDVVHHIEEIREDYDKRLDEDNLITLCHECHNNIHVNYDSEKKESLRCVIEKYRGEYD